MRRAISVILFILGGWMLMTELVVAFLDMEPGVGDTVFMVAIFAALAGLPLMLGAWASPGLRWRELGLTILIAAGAAAFCGAAIALILSDPAGQQFMAPEAHSLKFAPLIGVVNLLVVAAVGWLLYRRQSPREAA